MNNERKNKITSKILKFDRKIEIWVIGLWNEIPLLYGLWTVLINLYISKKFFGLNLNGSNNKNNDNIMEETDIIMNLFSFFIFSFKSSLNFSFDTK